MTGTVTQRRFLRNKASSYYRRQVPLLFAVFAVFLAGCPNGNGPTPSAPAPANGHAILGWGGNSAGQIGDGSTSQRLTPVLIQSPNLKAIASAGEFSLAVTTDGRVLEWGGGRQAPAEITGLTSVKQIAVGERHRLALKEDGTVWAWGENDKGQLGDGSTANRPTPVQVAGLTNVASIAAGARHSLAIKTDLSIWSWGSNAEGQLGDGSKADRNVPVGVQGIKAIEVAASTGHSIALTTDLKLMGWGRNVECQLGVDPRNDPFDPIVCSEHLTPAAVFETGVAPFPRSTGRAIAAMATASFVVLSNGDVYGIGGHGDPNLFRGMCNTDLVIGPARLPIFAPIKEVAAGTNHALFLTDTHNVWSLGANLAGQGGLGTTTAQECPGPVSPSAVKGVSQVAAGKEHSLALVRGILEISPLPVTFGNVTVGLKTTVSVNVNNAGLAPVVFRNIEVSPAAEFSVTHDCPVAPGIFAPAANCTMKVTFSPASAGSRTGKIIYTSDAAGSPQEVALTGNGT